MKKETASSETSLKENMINQAVLCVLNYERICLFESKLPDGANSYPYNVTYGASKTSSMQLFLCDMWARWFRVCIQITCSISVSNVCCFIGKMTLSKTLSCDSVVDGAFFPQPDFHLLFTPKLP